MQPFERLRYLARWTDDDGPELIGEAADCLAAFDGDPAGLVVACRRLLVHHPALTPLWWLCSTVLAAPEASDGAWDAWQDLRDDRTPQHLARALPFPHDEPVAVMGWPDSIAAAVAERPDLDVLAVRPRGGGNALSRRLRASARPVRVVGESEVLALAPTHVLVDVAAAGGTTVLVEAGVADIVAALRAHGAKVWLVAGMGRVLPERLLTARRAAAGDADPDEELAIDPADRVVGPHGNEAAATLARRSDCPTAPELLRLGG
jgi:hypothetical protein